MWWANNLHWVLGCRVFVRSPLISACALACCAWLGSRGVALFCHSACTECTKSYRHLLLVLMKHIFRSICGKRLSTSSSVLQKQHALGAVVPAFLSPHLTHGICFTVLVLCQDWESDWGRYLLTVSQNLGVPGVINCANSHFLRSTLGDPLGYEPANHSANEGLKPVSLPVTHVKLKLWSWQE